MRISTDLPHDRRIGHLQKKLQDADPRQFYVPPNALHLTMKSIRTIADPPNYTAEELSRVKALLPDFTREYSPIPMVGHGLLRTPTSCSIPVSTEAEFGRFVCDLDRVLNTQGVPDDKLYYSTEVFFSNVTFVRYSCTPNKEFWDVLSGFDSLELPLFFIDTVKLLSSNLAFSHELYEEFGAFKLNIRKVPSFW
jgi:2'-5' RNA ligase